MKNKIISIYVKAISVTQKITKLEIHWCFPDVNLTHECSVGWPKQKDSVKASGTIHTGGGFLETFVLTLMQT